MLQMLCFTIKVLLSKYLFNTVRTTPQWLTLLFRTRKYFIPQQLLTHSTKVKCSPQCCTASTSRVVLLICTQISMLHSKKCYMIGIKSLTDFFNHLLHKCASLSMFNLLNHSYSLALTSFALLHLGTHDIPPFLLLPLWLILSRSYTYQLFLPFLTWTSFLWNLQWLLAAVILQEFKQNIYVITVISLVWSEYCFFLQTQQVKEGDVGIKYMDADVY